MSSVTLENGYKRYGETVAVNNANLKVADKEFIVLVGPSGCGKSSMLRMIAGLEEISEGNLYIGDHLVNEVSPKDRDIAMVFQNYALYPHMTVYDNMSFGLKIRKFSKIEIRNRVDYASEILGIEKLLDRKPNTLSGGQRQRVALGRAIVRMPKVFLLDEPLSNLDAKLRTQMRIELKKLHRRLKATIIYVTHDQVEAMTLGDRIVVMNNGVILQVGTPLEIYNHPADVFVAGFIGNPPMNTIKCLLAMDNNGIFVQISGWKIRISADISQSINKYLDKEVILGIRPEDILIKPTAKHENKITAVIETVDLLGSETILTLNIGSESVIALVYNGYLPQEHEATDISFNLDKLTLFDAATGRAIFSAVNSLDKHLVSAEGGGIY